MGGATEKEKMLQAEEQKLGKKIKDESDSVTKMIQSKGWDVVERYLEAKIKAIHIRMEGCSEKELIQYQAEIKAIKGLFGFLGSKVVQVFDK